MFWQSQHILSISWRGEIWAHKTSLTLRRFIEVQCTKTFYRITCTKMFYRITCTKTFYRITCTRRFIKLPVPRRFIEVSVPSQGNVPVPSQENETSCICVSRIIFASFYDFDIWFWNCSDSVVFLGFLDFGTVQRVWYF